MLTQSKETAIHFIHEYGIVEANSQFHFPYNISNQGKLAPAIYASECKENDLGSLAPSSMKIKCTLVQALRLSTGRTTRRGSRRIALLFLYHGTRSG